MSQALHFGSDSVQRYKRWNWTFRFLRCYFRIVIKQGLTNPHLKCFFAWECNSLTWKKCWNVGLPFTTSWNSILQDLKKKCQAVCNCGLWWFYAGTKEVQISSKFATTPLDFPGRSVSARLFKRRTYFWFMMNLFFPCRQLLKLLQLYQYQSNKSGTSTSSQILISNFNKELLQLFW